MLKPILPRRWQRQQAGDTIVEVMVVLAVLGLAIGISYATANRSLLNARQAQENTTATELAQSQVEAIQAIGCTSASSTCDPTDSNSLAYALFNAPSGASNFCMNTTASPPTPEWNDASNLAAYNSTCTNIDNLYSIKNTYNSSTHNFSVIVSWDDVVGQGTDTVTMNYSLPNTVSDAANQAILRSRWA